MIGVVRASEAAENHVAGRRLVVVSPHLDDGVLSLGASMVAWRRAGMTIELRTVVGCEPECAAPTGGWDRRGGFATEGESAGARREEDRRACAIVGATPVWLPFGSVDYERHGDEGDVRGAVERAVEGADLVLLPGSPLTHPDHEWLTRILLAGDLEGRLGLYAEQPYTRREGADPDVPVAVVEALGATPVFEKLPVRALDRLAKWRAIRSYRSQLPLLGMRRTLRRGPGRYALAREWVAWLPV
jgi:LmbE family N-acetylglucosaminyl deacetylase